MDCHLCFFRVRAELGVLLWLVLPLIPLEAVAATKSYYLNSTTGSDSYNGLSPTVGSGGVGPFLTFAHACPLLNPGDSLTAASGTYTETADIDVVGHGSPTLPVTIQAADRAYPPVINEAQSSNANPPPAHSFKILTSNVTLTGIDVVGGLYGIYVTQGETNVTISNCSVTSSYQAGIMLNGGTSSPITDVVIQNCSVVNCGQINQDRSGARNWPHAILGLYSNNVTIEGCVVHDNYGEGLGPYTGCQTWSISDNTVYDNYSVNIYLDTDIGGMTVQRNFVFCTYKYDPTNVRNRPDGIRIANETANSSSPPPPPSNYTVVNNIVCGGDSGIRCTSYGSSYVPQGISQGLIANNTILSQMANPNSHGIWFGYDGAPNQNVMIFNNAAYSATGTGATFDLSGPGLTDGANLNPSTPGFVNVDVTWNSTTPPQASFYQLTSSSPYINQGVASEAPTTDFAQNARDSQPDVGAYEYLAATSGNAATDTPVMPAWAEVMMAALLCGAAVFEIEARRRAARAMQAGQ